MDRLWVSYVDRLELENFLPREFDVGGGIPPRVLWDNIVPTAIIADWCRTELGLPIAITSAYRDERYNADVRGGRLSNHQAFTALDLKPAGGDPVAVSRLWDLLREIRGDTFDVPFELDRRAVKVAAGLIPFRLLQLRSSTSFVFRGGLGRYRTFVHLDTRGIDATWG